MKIKNFKPGFKEIRVDDNEPGYGYIVSEKLLPLTIDELHDLIVKEKRMKYVNGMDRGWNIPLAIFAVIE
jgi:hypothetical protein